MSNKQSNRDNFLKRTEYFIKKKLDKFLKSSINPIFVTKPENQINLNSISRILILRNDRIGDLLISTSILRIIKNKYPDIKIDALISENNKAAICGFEPYIHEFYIYQKKINKLLNLINILKNIKYDLIIDLFDNPSTTNAVLLKFIKPIKTLGIRKEKTNIYDFEVPLLNKNSNHIIDRVSQLLLPFGINPQNENLKPEYRILKDEFKEAELLLGKKNNKIRLGINLSGSSRAKYWGSDNFLKFIDQINKNYNYIDIIIFITPEYKADAEYITSLNNAVIAPIVSNFNTFAAMLSTCDIILTPDTSAVHLASAFNIPCIALYLWSGLEEFGMPWKPYGVSNRCLTTTNTNLNSIDTWEVLKAFDELMIENNLKR